MSRIVIIGAGIGGLATANLLAREGHDVSVYEKSSQAGGRAGQKRVDGFTFDTGPSWYLMPEVFDRYYAAVGTSAAEQLDIVKLNPSYKVFFENDPPIAITGDRARDKATFEAVEPGAGTQLDRYARQAKKLYDLSLRYFLYTSFNRPSDFLQPGIIARLPWIFRLMATPIHSYVTRFVRATRLQQILEYPMVFLGTSPFEAPALYSLMGALDFDSGVFYPRGGIYKIIESLVAIGRKAGVSYNFDTDVSSIRTRDGRATGISLADDTVVDADIVISNADLHFTETKLLTGHSQSFPESYWASRQPSCSSLLIYLGVKGPVPELEHHNLLFVDAWRENFDALYHSQTIPEKASLYLSRTSATDPGVSPAGDEALFVLVPLPADSALTADQLTASAAHYINQIEKMTGISIKDRIVHKSYFAPQDYASTFNSWRNSMLGPSHVLRQSAFWRTPNKSRKLANLYYVGAGTVPGVGLPMCLISAQNVVKRIAKEQAS